MGVLNVLGIPFGGPHDGKDAHGEYFSPNTDTGTDFIYLPPVFDKHGAASGGSPEEIAEATDRWLDDDGWWFEVKLPMDTADGKKKWKAAEEGRLYASSGCIPASKDTADDGEILKWMLAELSIIEFDGKPENQPANFYATATPKKQLVKYVAEENRGEFEKLFKENEMTVEEMQAAFGPMLDAALAPLSKRLDAAESILTQKDGCGCTGEALPDALTGDEADEKVAEIKMDPEEIVEMAADEIVAGIEAGATVEDVEEMIHDAVTEVVDEIIATEDEAMDEEEMMAMRSSPQKRSGRKRRIMNSTKEALQAAADTAFAQVEAVSADAAPSATEQALEARLAEMEALVAERDEADAVRTDGEWIEAQQKLGRVEDGQVAKLAKSLVGARAADRVMKSGASLHAQIKESVEAKEENVANAANYIALKMAPTVPTQKIDNAPDPETVARMRQYAGIKTEASA